MAADRQAEGPGALLGPEQYIEDNVSSNLLSASASWPTPPVVDQNYGRYRWTPLGGALVEHRSAAVDSRRMVSILTTIRGMYGPVHAVPEGTVTDFFCFRGREDWRDFQVLVHFAVHELLSEVGDKPRFSWEYHLGSPPKLREEDCGAYVPGAMEEWTIGTSIGLLTLFEQCEVRAAPVVRQKGKYRTKPVWWELSEIFRGMAAQVPQMEARQGSQLMAEVLGGPCHMTFATLCALEVADVFVGSICYHEHFWSPPLAMRSAFAGQTTESPCSEDPSVRPLLGAGLKLLRFIEERARSSCLPWTGGPRGVLRCAKTLDDEGPFVLLDGREDPRLHYSRDVTHLHSCRLLDRGLADTASALVVLAVAPEHPWAPAAAASAPFSLKPLLWGGASRPTYIPRRARPYTCALRASSLGGGSGTVPLFGGHAGPPLATLPLHTWEGSA